jgi:hypothetical protein
MSSATPEQMQAVMQAWMAWAKKTWSDLVDLGQPLRYVTTTTASGAEKGESQVAGFSILQAESEAALQDLLKGHPHFSAPGASIAVLQCMPIPGM